MKEELLFIVCKTSHRKHRLKTSVSEKGGEGNIKRKQGDTDLNCRWIWSSSSLNIHPSDFDLGPASSLVRLVSASLTSLVSKIQAILKDDNLAEISSHTLPLPPSTKRRDQGRYTNSDSSFQPETRLRRPVVFVYPEEQSAAVSATNPALSSILKNPGCVLGKAPNLSNRSGV